MSQKYMQKLLSWLEKSQKYLIAAVLITIPLFPKFPFIRIPGTYVSIRLEDFLIAVITILFLIYFFPDILKIIKLPVEKAIVLSIAIGFISLVSGIFLTQTVPLHIGILHWLRRIEYFLPFFFGVLYFRKNGSRDLEFFFKVLMIVIPLLFIYGMGQKYFSWPVIITQNEEYAKGIALRWIPGSHINSTFAGHYDLATFLVFLLPFFISFFFILKGFWTKFSLAVVVFSGLWLLANAVSRISVVSYLLGTVVSLLLIKKYKAIPIVIVVSLIFFSFSGDLLARYTRIIRVVFAADETVLPQRQASSNTPENQVSIFEDRSTSIRLKVEWPRALRAFSKNPLLGTGYSSITLATDNDFLRLLGEVGILGLLAFILIFVNIGLLIRKILPYLGSMKALEFGFFASYIGAMVGVFTNSLFIDVFEASKFAIIFWLVTGFFVSLSRNFIHEEI